MEKMSSEMKSKVQNELRNKKFQVLVATEAYEIRTQEFTYTNNNGFPYLPNIVALHYQVHSSICLLT